MQILIISPHKGMLEFLLSRGLIDNGATIEQVSKATMVTDDQIKNKTVFISSYSFPNGTLEYDALSLNFASMARSITNIHLNLSSSLLGASLNATNIGQICGDIKTYAVNQVNLLNCDMPSSIDPILELESKGSFTADDQIDVLDTIRNAVWEDSDNLCMEDTERTLLAIAGNFFTADSDLSMIEKGKLVLSNHSELWERDTDLLQYWLLCRAYTLAKGKVVRAKTYNAWLDLFGNLYSANLTQEEAEMQAQDMLNVKG